MNIGLLTELKNQPGRLHQLLSALVEVLSLWLCQELWWALAFVCAFRLCVLCG